MPSASSSACAWLSRAASVSAASSSMAEVVPAVSWAWAIMPKRLAKKNFRAVAIRDRALSVGSLRNSHDTVIVAGSCSSSRSWSAAASEGGSTR